MHLVPASERLSRARSGHYWISLGLLHETSLSSKELLAALDTDTREYLLTQVGDIIDVEFPIDRMVVPYTLRIIGVRLERAGSWYASSD